jgi:hypothetical protein
MMISQDDFLAVGKIGSRWASAMANKDLCQGSRSSKVSSRQSNTKKSFYVGDVVFVGDDNLWFYGDHSAVVAILNWRRRWRRHREGLSAAYYIRSEICGESGRGGAGCMANVVDDAVVAVATRVVFVTFTTIGGC